MKYRVLSDDELSYFENDLKAFLIINGIDGPDWEKINRETPEKALILVELFSDQVLQTVYERIHFLEHRSKSSLLAFHIGNEIINLIAVNTHSAHVDLSTVAGIHHALQTQINDLEFFTSQKSIDRERELHVHELIEQGAFPSSDSFFSSLKSLVSNS